MIRAVAIVSLVVLLVLVLYVPSAHPPSRFFEQLRSEHDTAVAFWGTEPAYRILDRAMRLQSGTAAVSSLSSPPNMFGPAGVNGAVSVEMASVSQRLFGNPYFRSIDALLVLASYRLTTLLEWLSWLLPLVLVAGVDGGLVRVIRAKEFLQHDPEMFAVWCSLLIITACATVIAFVLPVAVHPAALACSPIAMAALLDLAITNWDAPISPDTPVSYTAAILSSNCTGLT